MGLFVFMCLCKCVIDTQTSIFHKEYIKGRDISKVWAVELVLLIQAVNASLSGGAEPIELSLC